MFEEISQLANAGMVGIVLAMIGLLVYIVRAAVKLANNHLEHNTTALTELTKAIAELKTYLETKNGN